MFLLLLLLSFNLIISMLCDLSKIFSGFFWLFRFLEWGFGKAIDQGMKVLVSKLCYFSMILYYSDFVCFIQERSAQFNYARLSGFNNAMQRYYQRMYGLEVRAIDTTSNTLTNGYVPTESPCKNMWLAMLNQQESCESSQQ